MERPETDEILAIARTQDADRRRRVLDDLADSAQPASIRPLSLDPDLRRVIPPSVARAYSAVAIGEQDGKPIVAMENPRDHEALGALCRLLSPGFRIVVSPRDEVLRAIDELYW